MTKKPLGAFGPLRQHEVQDPDRPIAERSVGGRRRRKDGEGPEAKIQKAWVAWAREVGLEIQHQNNGANTLAARIRLNAMGCTAGAADVLVFDRLPRCPDARGLALEFKSNAGEQSDDQKAWQGRLEKLGWRYHVVRSKAEAIQVVQWYGLAVS